MRLRSIKAESLDIPFRVSFQHSSAIRKVTDTVLVTVEANRGICGVGEGCPRAYVTGETLETAIDFINANRIALLKIQSLRDLKLWVEMNKSKIDDHPAAFCAVEIALLNTMAKEKNQTVEQLLQLPEVEGMFCYTGVLGARNPNTFRSQLEQYLEMGLTDLKVKLFGDQDIDQGNLQTIKQYQDHELRLRFDANNLWSDPKEAQKYIEGLGCSFFALEEPLAAHDYDGFYHLAKALKRRIIVDESFNRIEHFACLIDQPEVWIVNLRISKMGGLIRSLAVAEKARQLKIPIIIGAQVGETSILTRAAITVANTYRDILIAQEGAFGTFLLERDVVKNPIMFGRGGIVTADRL